MNKQYAFALLFISLFISQQHIGAQEGPRRQGSSHSNEKVRRHEAEHETFAAIQESAKIMPYSDDFCKNAIAKAPTPLKEEIARLEDPRRRAEMLPAVLILHGPTGSGKTTLARIIMQRMNMPFIVVAGKKLANEYSNSGSAGIKRFENLAAEKNLNILIDEIDPVTKNKGKQNINDRDDDTPGALWTMLDTLEEHKLLLIGTTNDITCIPEALRNRLEGCLYHMPYISDLPQIGSLLDELLNGYTLENEQTKQKMQRQLAGQPTRTVKKVIRGAIKIARDRNLEVPIITSSDFQSALKKIKDDRKSLQQTAYNREKIINYTFQTISVATALSSFYLAYQNHQLAIQNNALGVQSLELAKKVAELNADYQQKAAELAKKVADANADYQQKAFELQGFSAGCAVLSLGLAAAKIAGAASVAAPAAPMMCTIV